MVFALSSGALVIIGITFLPGPVPGSCAAVPFGVLGKTKETTYLCIYVGLVLGWWLWVVG
jgi:hypothetical protein